MVHNRLTSTLKVAIVGFAPCYALIDRAYDVRYGDQKQPKQGAFRHVGQRAQQGERVHGYSTVVGGSGIPEQWNGKEEGRQQRQEGGLCPAYTYE